MPIEGRITVGVIDHQVMRCGAMFQRIYLGYHPVADGDNGITTARAKVYTKMQSLSGLIELSPLAESAGGIAIGLPKQPGGRPRWILEGQPEGALCLCGRPGGWLDN